MTDINEHMAAVTLAAAKTALKGAMSAASERRFLRRFMRSAARKQNIRARRAAGDIAVPPFLIASISSSCNLHCAGCYARQSGSCADNLADELPASRWRELFAEADSLGVGFVILAGGEPLMRRELLEMAAEFKDLLFLVFTNGTLFDEAMLALFDANRNLVPVLSLEGDEQETDERRGAGTHKKIDEAMAALRERGILFGSSITLTTQNLALTTSERYAASLREKGSRLLFYIEYVPTDPATTALAPGDAERAGAERNLARLRETFKDTVVVSFPGDEQALGGCLAAGRGFIHISPDGRAEPCPFAPVSDASLEQLSLREALASPLFRALRDSGILDRPHTGGCVLHEYKDELSALAATQ